MPKAEVRARVFSAAKTLGIEHLLERRPKELSGGQRQRVAIGRAIVREPSVFLFDEPLSNLDAALRVNTRLEIAKLHRQLGATMIYVTHDQVEAMTLASKIVVLNHGRIEQVGAPLDLYRNPRNLFVAGFIGSPRMNFIKGTVLVIDGGSAKVGFAGAEAVVNVTQGRLKPGDDVTVGIRPEHMAEPGGEAVALEGVIDAVERLGEASYVYMRLRSGDDVIVRASGETPAAAGERYVAHVPGRALHVFDGAGMAVGPDRPA
jgi:multiple sugar transport system ATP-binding protein